VAAAENLVSLETTVRFSEFTRYLDAGQSERFAEAFEFVVRPVVVR